MATVGEVFVDTLAASGVRRVYGIPGDSLNSVTDTIRRHPDLEWVHVRHEEAAAFAAGAEAHLTGDLAVCAGSCGPGNLHLINGLYDAHRSRVPVLAIAAHIPSGQNGTGYFQETHPEALFNECSHYCETVTQPEQVPRILEIAMRTAVAKRGVSVVILPGDIALKECPHPARTLKLDHQEPIIRPTNSELGQAAELLNAASKVVILGGAGCAGAHAELIHVANKLKAPVVHAMRGKEFIEYDNPYDIGMTGLLGFSSGYHAMMGCDTLLMLGTDFPYPQFYPHHAKIIQIDIRGEQIGRRTRVDIGLTGDVRHTLKALLPMLETKHDRSYLDTALAHYKKTREGLEHLASAHGSGIHPQYVARLIDELATEDAVFTCDVGTPTIWAARYLTMNGKRRLLGSFVHGSMANALPQAIGIQAAYPGRQVITLSGDGGLAMLMGDLLTLIKQKLPVKLVVFNNSSLSFVEMESKAAGILEFGTDLHNPDFSKVAEACGLLGLRAATADEVRPKLQQALEHDGPALVEVLVNRQELSMPPTLEAAQIAGFSLFMLKAVMSGKGTEIIDLAKENLFH